MPHSDSRSRSRSRSPSPYSRRAPRPHHRHSYSRSRSPRRRPSSRSPAPPNQSHHYRSRSPRRGDSRSYSPRRRDRSPSPYRRERTRSRSPPRRKEGKANMSGGFKWKDKSGHEGRDGRDEPRLERGYRELENPRQRSPIRDDVKSKFGDDYNERYARKPQANDVASKFGGGTDGGEEVTVGEKKKKKKEKKPEGPKPTGEPMIIVNVNDRLGTKVSVPCYGSDVIRLFKAQVAARIGRQPHEIMLKRQGERPFKDTLTLEDYGVSNGVQLDLEVDTGD